MGKTRTIRLMLDEDDQRAIVQAMAKRESLGRILDGDGNENGRAIAEICRGWLEFMAMDQPPAIYLCRPCMESHGIDWDEARRFKILVYGYCHECHGEQVEICKLPSGEQQEGGG